MVVRKERKGRKYLGSRRWGVGNIKNARGAGDRGGVGKGGKKHKFTYITAKAPELIGKRGFHTFEGKKKREEITLEEIGRRLERLVRDGKGAETLDLTGYKVLSNGELSRKVTIKAYAFSKKAAEKIKAAGGEAVSAVKSE